MSPGNLVPQILFVNSGWGHSSSCSMWRVWWVCSLFSLGLARGQFSLADYLSGKKEPNTLYLSRA
jgi:hypothetical protein